MASFPRCDHPFFPQFHTSPRPHSSTADHRCSQFLGGINSTRIPNWGAKGNKASRLTFNLDQFRKGKHRPCAQLAENLEEKDAKLFANGFLHHSDKILVAVDIDEVLGNFLLALNRFIADRYSLNHSISEYHVYEYSKERMY